MLKKNSPTFLPCDIILPYTVGRNTKTDHRKLCSFLVVTSCFTKPNCWPVGFSDKDAMLKLLTMSQMN